MASGVAILREVHLDELGGLTKSVVGGGDDTRLRLHGVTSWCTNMSWHNSILEEMRSWLYSISMPMLELESGWLLRSVRLGATIDERENHFGGIYFNRFFELGRRAIRISHTNGDVLAMWCLSVSLIKTINT